MHLWIYLLFLTQLQFSSALKCFVCNTNSIEDCLRFGDAKSCTSDDSCQTVTRWNDYGDVYKITTRCKQTDACYNNADQECSEKACHECCSENLCNRPDEEEPNATPDFNDGTTQIDENSGTDEEANNQCYSNDDCNEFATCRVDGVGDYVCSCDYGYEGDGMTCTDINIISTDDSFNHTSDIYFITPTAANEYHQTNNPFENEKANHINETTKNDNQNKDKDDKKPKPDDGDEKEQKPKFIIIGIGVGGGLALLLIISIVMVICCKRDKKKNSLKHLENKSYGLSENEKIQHDYDKPPKGNKMTNQHVYDNPPRGNKMTNRELPQTPSDNEYLEIIPPPSDYDYYEQPISKYDSIKEGEEYTSIDMVK